MRRGTHSKSRTHDASGNIVYSGVRNTIVSYIEKDGQIKKLTTAYEMTEDGNNKTPLRKQSGFDRLRRYARRRNVYVIQRKRGASVYRAQDIFGLRNIKSKCQGVSCTAEFKRNG